MARELKDMNIDIVPNIPDISVLYALIIAAAVGGVAGYIGSLMVTKRMALMGGALGHLTLPGVAIALRYDFDVSLGALAFLGFGIFIVWILEQQTMLPTEALTALVFASSLSIAFLFLPHKETEHALLGNIAQISFTTCVITTLAAIIIFFVIKHMYKKLILMSISSDLAQVEGVHISYAQLIYLVCIACMIAMGVRIVGGLMTAALVAIPACTSRNLCNYLNCYAYKSLLFGSIACISGIIVSVYSAIPVGPAIIIISTIIFLLSLLVKR
jgi:zinc transport system permease protein